MIQDVRMARKGLQILERTKAHDLLGGVLFRNPKRYLFMYATLVVFSLQYTASDPAIDKCISQNHAADGSQGGNRLPARSKFRMLISCRDLMQPGD